MTAWLPPSYFPSPLENATSDREGDADKILGQCEDEHQDVGSNKPAAGLV